MCVRGKCNYLCGRNEETDFFFFLWCATWNGWRVTWLARLMTPPYGVCVGRMRRMRRSNESQIVEMEMNAVLTDGGSQKSATGIPHSGCIFFFFFHPAAAADGEYRCLTWLIGGCHVTDESVLMEPPLHNKSAAGWSIREDDGWLVMKAMTRDCQPARCWHSVQTKHGTSARVWNISLRQRKTTGRSRN